MGRPFGVSLRHNIALFPRYGSVNRLTTVVYKISVKIRQAEKIRIAPHQNFAEGV